MRRKYLQYGYYPYVYRRKQYSAFSIVLLAVLAYIIIQSNVFTNDEAICNTPTDPDEFIGNEDATEDKD